MVTTFIATMSTHEFPNAEMEQSGGLLMSPIIASLTDRAGSSQKPAVFPTRVSKCKVQNPGPESHKMGIQR